MKNENTSLLSAALAVVMKNARPGKIGFLLFLSCFLISSQSAFCFGTRYQIAASAPPTGTTLYCPGAATSDYNHQAETTNCTDVSTNTNTITWQWVYDGTNNIAGATGSFVVDASTPPVVTLTAAQSAFLSSLSPGDHTLQCVYTPDNSNCSGTAGVGIASPVLTITIASTPGDVTVTGGGAFCANTVITATGDGSSTVYYQGTTSGGTSTTTPATTATVTSSGTYYFRAQNASGCWGNEGSVTVTIHPLPATIAGTNTVCVGATRTFTDATSGGTWTSSNGVVASVDASGVITGLSAGTSRITYTITSTGCLRTRVITAQPVPGAIGGTPEVCSGMSVTLTDANTGGTWSSPNATVSVGSGTGTVTGVSAGTATISYSFATGCRSTTVFTVDASPAAISGGSSLCVGTTITLTDADAGVWSTSDASVAPVSATGDVTGNGVGNAAISYTAANGCFKTHTVTVNQTPSAIGGSLNICQQSTSVLTNTYSGGVWSSSVTSVATIDASTGAVSGIAAGTTVITYAIGTCFATAVATVYPVPVANITGGGIYCSGGSGVPVGLDNSGASDINYSLYDGATLISTLSGTNLPLSFGLQTMTGTYHVVANNTTGGCTTNMPGSVTVNLSPVPTAYSVGGGGSYCTGGSGLAITLSGSDVNSFYQLYNGLVPVGPLVSGTDLPLSLGVQTASGTYMVIANPGAGAGCQVNMSGNASIIINPLPTAFSVTGGGGYCAGSSGQPIGLSFSVPGIQYQLYKGAALVAMVGGTNSAISFGSMTATGTYTVSALNTATGCTNAMSGSASISINPLPTPFFMTGGGTICSGDAPVPVGVTPSSATTNYQLFTASGPVGTPLAGTGGDLAFPPQTTSGVYTVLATIAATGCSAASTGTTTVIVNSKPLGFNVTGGGGYCSGGSGSSIGLSGSTSGVNYQLYRGSTAVGGPVAGTGSSFSFGSFTTAGTYTVSAMNATTTCTANMVGSTVITINPIPTGSITGGGSFCNGGTGVPLGVASPTQANTNYTLMLGSSALATLPGNGGALSFGSTFTTPGTYYVVATTPSTGCSANLTGTAVIAVNPLPTAYTVSGGGNYCAGGTGVAVGLNPSATGVNYQLYNGSTAIGTAVAGTGSPISFGVQTLSTTFTVFASNPGTGCTNTMSGSATVGINPLPTAFGVTGGGTYCSGNGGLLVGLGASTSGVNYQLYNGGLAVGGPMPGTGIAISFGSMTTAGTYTVQATNATTGCTNAMSGSVIISIKSNPSNAYFVTSSAPAYCAGGTGIAIGLSGSEPSTTYQLYNGSSSTGTASGTGGAISFGSQTMAGTYTVIATNSGGCSSNITTGATIAINPVPTVFMVGGGGSFCNSVAGANVNLSGSSMGISYQLYDNVGTPAAGAVSGTGAAFNFGLLPAGTYTAVGTDMATGCTSNMAGSASVNMNLIPAVQSVTGGGVYCAGGTGVPVGLGNSASGVSYQLYLGSTPVTSMIGNGLPLTFGLQTATGTYSVLATNAAGCTAGMSGVATISTNPTPNVYTLSGGGNFCAGGTGVSMILSGSNTDISYQLYNGGIPYGAAVSGTGGALTFSGLTSGGSYNVIGMNPLTSCTSNMAGASSVVVNPLPTQFIVSGGGGYCNGGAGVEITLNGSTPGVAYQLYDGTLAIGSMVAGTGLPFSFGFKTTPGNYTVMAINTATSCVNTMLGSPSVVVNMPPAVFNVTGGGGYCNGTSGVAIGIDNSETGVSYQLYTGTGVVGSPVIGVGDAITFGTFSTSGTYTVLATNTSTSCASAMSGNAVVSINSLPTTFNVIGGGTMCNGSAGVNVNLNNSTSGVSYQLMNASVPVGAPVAGTGGPITFGPQTLAGNYTALAVNTTTGCQRIMTGSANVVVNMPPVAQPISGGGAYCSGDEGQLVGLGNSTSGISYQLYNGTSAVGTPVTGTGGSISFGLQTAAGNYNVVATNPVTSCSSAMTGVATISVNALPIAYTLSGGGNVCAGVGAPIVLMGSNTGISYQLMNGSTPVGSSVNGTGGSLNFGLQYIAGTYAVVATNNTTTCSNMMSGNPVVNVNALPLVYTVTGGGSYCSGGAGMPVGLSSSASGVSYQLYNGGTPVGSAVPGYGDVISFGNQTGAGDYSVMAINNSTSCSSPMSGVVTISVNALPNSYPVTGGGTMCNGATGVTVGLGNSASGVTYQLFNGATTAGSSVTSTGGPITFDAVTMAGIYTVQATSVDGCNRNMSGSATVVVNPLPVAQTVSGGGSYCTGGTGVNVGLNSSVTGVTYQLFNGTSMTGGSVAGTGNAVSFGPQTAAGVYTVMATTTATGCTNNMTGSATVIMNGLPNAYAVLGTASSYCQGSEGVHVLLSNSDPLVNYQLMNGSTPVGGSFAGSGSAIDFGAVTSAGVYKVVGTNGFGCSSNMTGSAAVQVNALPVAYAISGGGNYCTGSAGSVVGLAGSNTGVNYQLYRNGSVVGTPVAGTGSNITFGPQTGTGTYMVVATGNTTACTNNMTGTVSIAPNALPSAFPVTGGGTTCSGAAGVPVGLLSSAANVTYQLYNDGVSVGSAVTGTGGSITFGNQNVAGVYTVMATGIATGCTRPMSSSVSVIVNPLPATTYTVTGTGSYCTGGTGVEVGLSGSANGVTYQLFNGSTPIIGSSVVGSGSALSFGTRNAGNYSVVGTNNITGCSSTMTGTANVVANLLPTAVAVTGGGSYCSTGSSTGVPVGLASSTAGITYELSNELGVVTSAPGTGSSVSFGNQMAAGVYSVIATNTATGCTNMMSGTATINVNTPVTPAVSISTGIGNTVCLGTLITFTATAVNGGSAPTYQWQVNGSAVGLGFNTYTYVPANGDVVSVALTSSESCATPTIVTNSITITVSAHQSPVAHVTVTPNDSVCAGTTVTYSVTPEFGGTAPTYVWQKNGATVGTGTSYSYVPSNNDVITVRMTSNFPCRLTDEAHTDVTMTVIAPVTPSVLIHANPGVNVIPGRTVTLTADVTNGGANPGFQWFSNGGMIGGATNGTYTSNNFANDDSISVLVTNQGVCSPTFASASVVMKVTSEGVAGVGSSLKDMTLIPNPNKGDFIIKGSLGTTSDKELTVEVTDMLGQVVYKGTIQAHNGNVNEKIQISKTLANGMYLLNLHSDTDHVVFHFILEN